MLVLLKVFTTERLIANKQERPVYFNRGSTVYSVCLLTRLRVYTEFTIFWGQLLNQATQTTNTFQAYVQIKLNVRLQTVQYSTILNTAVKKQLKNNFKTNHYQQKPFKGRHWNKELPLRVGKQNTTHWLPKQPIFIKYEKPQFTHRCYWG